jgi:hypothetical protein
MRSGFAHPCYAALWADRLFGLMAGVKDETATQAHPRPVTTRGRTVCRLVFPCYDSSFYAPCSRYKGASQCRPVIDRIEGESSTKMGRPRRNCRPSCQRRTTSPHRESGLTSLRCSVTRDPRPTDSGRQADMSAAEMPAGAAPGRALWRTVRRLQVRIVKAVAQAAASREGRL